jgi:putative transposase
MKNETKAQRTRKATPKNRTTTGYRVSDELWAMLEPVLPVHVNTHRFGGGRPRVPDRKCADAIFYVLRTGVQWEALNEPELCAKSTAHDRFEEWVAAGVFLKLWQAGVEQFDELKGIEWEWLSLAQRAPRAMTKAPLGGEKNRPQSNGPRQSRGQAESVDGGSGGSYRFGGGRRQSS